MNRYSSLRIGVVHGVMRYAWPDEHDVAAGPLYPFGADVLEDITLDIDTDLAKRVGFGARHAGLGQGASTLEMILSHDQWMVLRQRMADFLNVS